jgi:hypothetical protein
VVPAAFACAAVHAAVGSAVGLAVPPAVASSPPEPLAPQYAPTNRLLHRSNIELVHLRAVRAMGKRRTNSQCWRRGMHMDATVAR